MKKVLLIVIDALTARIMESAMDAGKFPTLQALRQKGEFSANCTSIFPSITHAALTSIVTGKYPVDHGVIGSHWYIADKDEVAYYGADPQIIFNEGIGEFAQDFMLKLNHERLQALTLFQKVERQGLEAASLNFLIFHGDQPHEVDMHFLLKIIPALPTQVTIQGPKNLFLGDFIQQLAVAIDPDRVAGGLVNWFGFQDKVTIELLCHLAENRAFPDFTLAYFPKNDFASHRLGPEAAHEQLTSFDARLGQMLAEYGGIDAFLDEHALIMVGDHSQSDIFDEAGKVSIRLNELLPDFQLATDGQTWHEGDQLIACPNLRAAQVYFKEPQAESVSQAMEMALADSRIDQVVYRASRLHEGEGYSVVGQNGRLRFWHSEGEAPAAEANGAEGSARDRQGNTWRWQGDLSVVDGQVAGETITFPDYPNAFERIAGVMDSRDSGQLWLTARLGYEFLTPQLGVHAGGGSHGSLHRLDSTVPLLVAGVPSTFTMPVQPRLVDVAPISLSILGISDS